MSVAHVVNGVLSYALALGLVSLMFKGRFTRREWLMIALALGVVPILVSVYDRAARALGLGDVARLLILAVVCGASVGVGYWRSRRRAQQGPEG